MEIKEARRKSFNVTYVKVTEGNIEQVAEWCGGEVGGEGAERFVKVNDKNAISTGQAKAYVDDYVLKMSESGTSFKKFTEKSFKKSYEPLTNTLKVTHVNQDDPNPSEREVARSAKDGQFVTKAEAKANPDTTVVETVGGETEFGVTKLVTKTEIESLGEGQPYYEVHPAKNAKDENDVVTVYYKASGEEITRAEYDAWRK